ncbi:hypothetical protein [sulfur-oxidizing endosymbiont of Gigantopelta aegis]|uniref:hypothetical protein n=1 Tax=sulfur-oxidizing endosymbiont of Gigantopelta aegis TaxID=2794934 RepID=UPI0018DC05DB|nr:hypothetical protein [sulfur-oxidizing endosymbiont of Gigantopelta aegis]
MKNIKFNKKYLLITGSFIIITGLNGCSKNTDNQPQQTIQTEQVDSQKDYFGEANRIQKFSADKKYQAALYTNAFPLKTGVIHSWILQVTTPDGQAVEAKKIYVHGGMPMHQHGFPTTPRTQYLGNGLYVFSRAFPCTVSVANGRRAS